MYFSNYSKIVDKVILMGVLCAYAHNEFDMKTSIRLLNCTVQTYA